jgi:hypothetical protein
MNRIIKTDCGSVLTGIGSDRTGYGNACFLLSLMEGMASINSTGKYFTTILNSDLWKTKKGKMISTSDDENLIQVLAIRLNIVIVVYTEIENDKVNLNNPVVFNGLPKLYKKGNVVRIVKVMNKPHFNFMKFLTLSDTITLGESQAYINRLVLKNEQEPPEIPAPTPVVAPTPVKTDTPVSNFSEILPEIRNMNASVEVMKIQRNIQESTLKLQGIHDLLKIKMDSLTDSIISTHSSDKDKILKLQLSIEGFFLEYDKLYKFINFLYDELNRIQK